MIANQFNVIPKSVRIDNGSEFMLNQFYTCKGNLGEKSWEDLLC